RLGRPGTCPTPLVPAQAGTQSLSRMRWLPWIPACAGMSGVLIQLPRDMLRLIIAPILHTLDAALARGQHLESMASLRTSKPVDLAHFDTVEKAEQLRGGDNAPLLGPVLPMAL